MVRPGAIEIKIGIVTGTAIVTIEMVADTETMLLTRAIRPGSTRAKVMHRGIRIIIRSGRTITAAVTMAIPLLTAGTSRRFAKDSFEVTMRVTVAMAGAIDVAEA